MRKVIKGVNDLATLRPDLASEWNYDKNDGIQPNTVSLHSNVKYWWKCSVCGYEWRANANDRANGKGCPECAKKKRINSFRENYVIRGANDLKTLRPDLMKEWDYFKNVVNPEDYTINSNEKVWWKCSICGMNGEQR